MLEQVKTVDNRRLYLQIADQIRALIREGNLSVGARLPPERDLAQRLGVSRPSVREALIALEIQGVVDIRMGSGVFVLKTVPTTTGVEGLQMGDSPMELMQARSVIEGTLAGLACIRLDGAEALRPIREAMAAMRNAVAQGRAPLAADREFHLSIARLGGNSVMVRMVGELFDGRHSPISQQLSLRTETLQSWETALQEHQTILSALEGRDALLAEAAMRAHLSASRLRWLEQVADAEGRDAASSPDATRVRTVGGLVFQPPG